MPVRVFCPDCKGQTLVEGGKLFNDTTCAYCGSDFLPGHHRLGDQGAESAGWGGFDDAGPKRKPTGIPLGWIVGLVAAALAVGFFLLLRNRADWVLLAVLIVPSLIVYALPAAVAIYRNHNNLAAILVLNIFLGWTLIGWAIAMAWAVANPPAAKK